MSQLRSRATLGDSPLRSSVERKPSYHTFESTLRSYYRKFILRLWAKVIPHVPLNMAPHTSALRHGIAHAREVGRLEL
jgi:hypothetical protein